MPVGGGGLISAVIAMALGYPCFRLRGHYFVIATIVIAEEGDDTVAPFADFLFELPRVPKLFQPLVATVPLQIFAAEIARSRGYDIDKPRNLAKSVTVE